MMRVALVALIVVAGACKGNDSKVADKAPTATTTTPAAGDAAVADVARLGPPIEIVRCAAALPPPTMKLPVTSGPKVTLGKPTVSGSLPASRVTEAMRRYLNRITYCYDQRLVRDASVAGSALLTLNIKAEGWVFEAHVEKSFDEELSLCIKHVISESAFPPAPAGKTAPTLVTQPLTFAWSAPERAQVTTPEPTAWTPFAASTMHAPALVAEPAALGVRKVLPLAKLEQCYGERTGSIRTIMKLATDGSVVAARSGGLGDAAMDACVTKALVGIKAHPIDVSAEIVCDFARGSPSAWRVSEAAGYSVIDLATRFDHTASPADADKTFLVIIDAATPAAQLGHALGLTAQGAATVVALRHDKELVFVAALGPAVPDPTTPVTLDTKEPLRACSVLLDGGQVVGTWDTADKLLATASRACTHKPCPAPLMVTLDGSRATGIALAGLAGAARAAGFERITFGSGSCAGLQK